jgi:hypothetical protein
MHCVQFVEVTVHYLQGELQASHINEEFAKYPFRQEE